MDRISAIEHLRVPLLGVIVELFAKIGLTEGGGVERIPGHALRLARWDARPKEDRRPERWSPLRVGRPPGYRQRHIHPVDAILKECHWLATAGNPPLDDTS